MLSINENYSNLNPSYLFPEMKKRVSELLINWPSDHIYNLGEGDTTQPLSSNVARAMVQKVKEMASGVSFMGYSDPVGLLKLRKSIAHYYATNFKIPLDIAEIFISDGAKTDLFNIQTIFNDKMKIAIQDPSYPVYIDSIVINGRTEKKNQIYDNLIFLNGTPENNFIPSLPKKRVDLFYLSFPNNPTGAVATRKQLKEFVDYANENGSIIIFDSVYSWFIREKNYPKSIYEIPEAEKCAIEIQSFSKSLFRFFDLSSRFVVI